jgi:hypothetical protein
LFYTGKVGFSQIIQWVSLCLHFRQFPELLLVA